MGSRGWVYRAGVWLFRWRSYLPLVFLAFLVAEAIFDGTTRVRRTPGWEAVVLAVGLSGLAVRLHVAGHVPGGTSGRNTLGQEAAQLNTTGLYSVVRHPLYLGNFLMWMGIALFPQRLWVTLVVAVAFWCVYLPMIVVEDRWLRESFGRDHEAWAARTPAILPRLDRWRAPALPFSLRTAARREYSGAFAFISVLTLLVTVNDWGASGHPRLAPYWHSAFAAGLVAYLTLRHLKRHTRVLHVAGR